MGYFHGEEIVTNNNISTNDMKGKKIINVKSPDSTSDSQTAVTVKFLNDHFVHKKANNTQNPSDLSNILEAALNMNSNRLFGLPSALIDSGAILLAYLKSHIYVSLSETLMWEYYTKYGIALYKFDRGISSEVTFDSSTRKVSKIFDQTLFGNHANQNTLANQPTLCSSANRINNRYYLDFNGSQRMLSDIDLNVSVGGQDIVNIFIVYKLDRHQSTTWSNGLFGMDDGGYDKFVSVATQGDLVVSGTTTDFIVIGSNVVSRRSPWAPYLAKVNAGELNKWICLSIHWDVPSGTNKSSVWINGKKITNFTAKTSTGAAQTTLGDFDPNSVASLDGSIAFFGLYKERIISDPDIKLHHYVLCKNWYNIDHDPIQLG